MSNYKNDLESQLSRHEISEVLGCTIGALSFGAAATTALSEILVEQPERYYLAGALAALSIAGLVKATMSGRRIPELQAELRNINQSDLTSTNQQIKI